MGCRPCPFLHDQEILVVEADRPNCQVRRKQGKSDPTDAVSAARAAPSGTATVTPKTRNGQVERMRILMVARCSSGGDEWYLCGQALIDIGRQQIEDIIDEASD